MERSKFGSPTEVKFCKNCVESNQRFVSSVQHKMVEGEKKDTALFDEDGICLSCKYFERKERLLKGIHGDIEDIYGSLVKMQDARNQISDLTNRLDSEKYSNINDLAKLNESSLDSVFPPKLTPLSTQNKNPIFCMIGDDIGRDK